jgi:hypothetical protein
MGFALIGTITAAHAGTVPPATFDGTLNGGSSTLQTAGSITSNACSPGPDGGCESASLQLAFAGADATINASGTTAGGTGVPNAAGGGTIVFYFEVTGPANVSVPLDFSASGSTSASGTNVSAAAQAFSAGGAFYACSGAGSGAASCANGSGGVLPSAFGGTKIFNLTTNTLSDIEVVVSGGSTLGSGTWSASVDPQISIDPSFTQSGYALVVSPDVNPVPLPSTAWLLISGIGALGMFARRNQKTKEACAGTQPVRLQTYPIEFPRISNPGPTAYR